MSDNNPALDAFLEANPDIEIFEIILLDLCGGMRGKWVTRDKIHKVMGGGVKMPLSALALDSAQDGKVDVLVALSLAETVELDFGAVADADGTRRDPLDLRFTVVRLDDPTVEIDPTWDGASVRARSTRVRAPRVTRIASTAPRSMRSSVSSGCIRIIRKRPMPTT